MDHCCGVAPGADPGGGQQCGHRRDDQDGELLDSARRAGLAVGPGVGVVVHDNEGRVAAIGARAAEVAGSQAGRLLDVREDYWLVLDEDGVPAPHAERPPTPALRSGEAVRGVVLGLRDLDDGAVGTHRWVDVCSVPLVAPGVESQRAVLTSLAPVSGARETALRLREAEPMLRVLTESSTEIMSWLSRDLRVL